MVSGFLITRASLACDFLSETSPALHPYIRRRENRRRADRGGGQDEGTTSRSLSERNPPRFGSGGRTRRTRREDATTPSADRRGGPGGVASSPPRRSARLRQDGDHALPGERAGGVEGSGTGCSEERCDSASQRKPYLVVIQRCRRCRRAISTLQRAGGVRSIRIGARRRRTRPGDWVALYRGGRCSQGLVCRPRVAVLTQAPWPAPGKHRDRGCRPPGRMQPQGRSLVGDRWLANHGANHPQKLRRYHGFHKKMMPLCGAWRQIREVTGDY
jgi:hypothetical protein